MTKSGIRAPSNATNGTSSVTVLTCLGVSTTMNQGIGTIWWTRHGGPSSPSPLQSLQAAISRSLPVQCLRCRLPLPVVPPNVRVRSQERVDPLGVVSLGAILGVRSLRTAGGSAPAHVGRSNRHRRVSQTQPKTKNKFSAITDQCSCKPNPAPSSWTVVPASYARPAHAAICGCVPCVTGFMFMETRKTILKFVWEANSCTRTNGATATLPPESSGRVDVMPLAANFAAPHQTLPV